MATIVAAGGGGNWTAGATWTGGVVPTAADDVQLKSTSGNVTINAAAVCRSLDCTGYTNTLTHNSATTLTIGDGTAGPAGLALKLVSGMTYARVNSPTSDGAMAFVSTSATQQTITTAAKSMGNISINGSGSSYILGDSLNLQQLEGGLSILAGTLSCSTFAVTAAYIIVNGAAATINLGSATHILDRRGANWEVVSGTVNAQSSTLKLVTDSYFTSTFKGGGKTYNNVWFARDLAADGDNVVTGSNTFADFKDSGTYAHNLLFTAGTTQTVSTFTVSGVSAAARITINSAAASTATHAIVKSGGGTISCDWLNIQHSVATPASTWYAGANSVNNQATVTAGSGWRFTAVPPVLPPFPAAAAIAGMPAMTVEVSFVTDSLDTSPVWVDIAGYVRSGSIRSGRTNELDEFQTGSCSLTLDNRARTFDPSYTTGPYYGYLKARQQCRISATYSAVTYELFQGFVSGWTLAPDLSGDSVCQIQGYDGLSYLAGVDLPIDIYKIGRAHV